MRSGVHAGSLADAWFSVHTGHPEFPRDHDRVSSFLNIRVADIHAVYEQWRARGAEFLTHPTFSR